MADIASDHIFLRQRLLSVLLRPVIVIMVHHGATAVVPQLRCRYRRSLQIAAQVFHAVPRPPGLLRKMDFPVATILRLQVTPPLLPVADMPQPRQAARINQVVTFAQQANDGTPPDFFHRFLFEEQRPPDVMLYVQPAAGDGDVDMRMLVELAAVRVQGAEDVHFHTQLAGPSQHGAGGSPEERIQQRPVVTEEGPVQVRHGKRDVLPVAVGEDMRLLRNPLLCGFKSATAAGF